MKLKTGDILHCTRKGLLSWLIRKATKSKFNHTALVIVIWDQVYIVGSQKDGTHPKHFDYWIKKYGYKYEISRPIDINEKELSKRAFSKINIVYDFESLFIRGPWNLLTGRWKKKKNEFDKLYCTEYVAGWCFEIQYDGIMTPGEFREYCQERPEEFKNF